MPSTIQIQMKYFILVKGQEVDGKILLDREIIYLNLS